MICRDKMNLNLLIKLVKLANNNPNENEANLAARKVCKLIAEDNYQFNEPKTAQAKEGEWSGFSYPSNYDWFKDFYTQDFEQRRRNQQNVYEPYVQYEEPKKKKPKTKRVCTKCGLDVETSNTEEVFVCYICKWNKFNEEQENPQKYS